MHRTHYKADLLKSNVELLHNNCIVKVKMTIILSLYLCSLTIIL